MDRTILDDDEVHARDEYIKEVNAQITRVSDLFSVKIPHLSIPKLEHFNDIGIMMDKLPRLDVEYFQKEMSRRSIAEVVAKHLFKEIGENGLDTKKFRGGSLSIALTYILRKFGYNSTCDEWNGRREHFSELTFNTISFSPYYVADRLADLYEKEFMRYRLWDDTAIAALETYFFKGHPYNGPDEAYFSVYETGETPSFEEFIDFFDSCVRGEFIDEQNGQLISHQYTNSSGVSTYFAEYVPVVCLGQEKLKYYFEWRNKIIDSLEHE